MPGLSRPAWPLPADCLRVVDAETAGGRIDAWTVMGRELLCDAEDVRLTYVSAEVTVFPDAFADVLSWRLAFEISAYVEQGGNPQMYLEMYERALDKARAANDLELRPVRVHESPFLQERRVD